MLLKEGISLAKTFLKTCLTLSLVKGDLKHVAAFQEECKEESDATLTSQIVF
jgi:metal-responsive CopG/Arc/MetJ family transcriptional regulator